MSKRVTQLTEQDKQNMLSHSPYVLPDNPSSKNFTANQVRRKMYEAYLVVYDWLENVIAEINNSLDEVDESVNSKSTVLGETDENNRWKYLTIDGERKELGGTAEIEPYTGQNGVIVNPETKVIVVDATIVALKNDLLSYRTSANQDLIDAIKENTANKVSSWQNTPDNSHYPTEKLVKDTLDTAVEELESADDDLQESINVVSASVSDLEALVPNQASAQNQLADKDFVNSSISTATATHRGTYDVVDDLELTQDATHSEVEEALETLISVVTLNDYVFVYFKDSQDVITRYDRYKYNGSAWDYEYTLNNSSFTSNQWASINSGITATKVASYDAHIISTANPHSVSKAQVGLGNVDNTSDLNKPISTATQNALDGKQPNLSQAQLNAVNSGVNATKIGSYDAHIVDADAHVSDSDRTNWYNKQNALNDTQMGAVNSGATSTKIANYDTHLSSTAIHVTSTEKSTWNSKQSALSSTQLSAVNSGITSSKVSEITSNTSARHTHSNKTTLDGITSANLVSSSEKATWNAKQDALASGVNIKTINNQSLLGSGNIQTGGGLVHSETLPQATSSSPDFVNVGEFLFFKVEINWDEPIQDGDSLELTQVYSVNQIDDSLKIL